MIFYPYIFSKYFFNNEFINYNYHGYQTACHVSSNQSVLQWSGCFGAYDNIILGSC